MYAHEAYPSLPHDLLRSLSDALAPLGFAYSNDLLRGILFSRPDGVAVAVDHLIADRQWPFMYLTYTEEQNGLMNRHSSLYRGLVDDAGEVSGLPSLLSNLLTRDYENTDSIPVAAPDRQTSAIDPTTPEAYFEQAFIEVYGRENLDCVSREYPIVDVAGDNRFVDYYIETISGGIAIEKNGELYHHPQIVGKSRYLQQLMKQNSLVAYGAKVYRWSLSGMQFKDRFHEELKQYLGAASTFLRARKVSISRKFSLYKHQGNALDAIKAGRSRGETASLLVLPTGTGKTEILIADYARVCAESGGRVRGLMLVPTLQLKTQLTEAFRSRLPAYGIDLSNMRVGDSTEAEIVVQTYSWAIRHMHDFVVTDFDYVAVDEAHHAVAPALRKVIHRFNPKFILGLTATDQRLDSARLEDVFGRYDVSLSLVDAIRQGLLTPIKAFRLKSNVDLSEIRYNGRDYVNADLERTVTVPSRNILIIDTVERYFVDSSLGQKSGLVFCVSVKHAEQIAAGMRARGIVAEAVSGKDQRSADKVERYQKGEIQFLATCSLLTEGWDSPHTSVIVMARPTMSKVLYTQQLGRGTRKHPGKEALYVIDVVDNYGSLGTVRNIPWSVHALLGYSTYLPWGDVLSPSVSPSKEEVILAGLYESERAIEEIDIFTFEYKYPNHLSDEQFARELFVSTDTVRSWVKLGRVVPAIVVPFGHRHLNYYSPGQVAEVRANMGFKVHDETTQYEDFLEFLKERSYSMSYKMIMLLSMLKVADPNGECSLDDLSEEYARFYRERLNMGLPVDRPTCPYTLDNLNDANYVKESILRNPFEKFERKRFLYQCKDLNCIAFSATLWNIFDRPKEVGRIRSQMLADLDVYYRELKGIPNLSYWKDYWDVPDAATQVTETPTLRLIASPPDELRFAEYVPFFDIAAAAGSFGMEQEVSNMISGWLHLPKERLRKDMFVIRVKGHSMEPRIPDGSLALFRGGDALAGSRSGRIMLVQQRGTADPETGYSFTVKQYRSRKISDDEGTFRHTQIELISLNSEFAPIVIEAPDDDAFRVVGEFVKVIASSRLH